jgi:NAD(P)-dependent dehydrogenase (short-subunit alcohol dehydrogenase family)
MKFKNKTIIVTGGGRGIGEYISRKLGREGANIVVTSRTVEDIKRVS